MNATVLEWSIENLVTVTLMGLLGFALFAVLARVWKKAAVNMPLRDATIGG